VYVGLAAAWVLGAWAWTRWPSAVWFLALLVPVTGMVAFNRLQRRRSVLRNWPLLGPFRYFFEMLRPEIQQYFIESDVDHRPFGREFRELVYRRAKAVRDTQPFGTVRDLYAEGYEWMTHSVVSRRPCSEEPRVEVGGPDCRKPYSASRLNVSGMSYGSLSRNAVLAMNLGAKRGGFFHNTGEGGITPHHLRYGTDLVWQIGTGYFGCRTSEGDFDEEQFREQAAREQVRMIELKLSQGAKPGGGGILPAKKGTPEIAEIRGVPAGKDVLSPPAHRMFATPRELVQCVARLRELSGGKPVGVKLCLGDRVEFLSLCKAMLEEGTAPDFVTVDGAEGGTGAAPLEFANSVGWPLRDAIAFVHGALVGAGLRDRMRIIASGKIVTGFHMVRALALGADLCNSARGMMFAAGCIQARRCNTNNCPVGVTTNDPRLERGLVVEDKGPRVERFHRETIASFLKLIAAAGLDHPRELRPHHVWRRVDISTTHHYGRMYEPPPEGSFESGGAPEPYPSLWEAADADRFAQEYLRVRDLDTGG